MESNLLTNTLDIAKIRQDFPILNQKVNKHHLAYLDNAATTQKPQCVIDVFNDYYTKFNSNIHRGIHTLSEKATYEFENARTQIQKFINAKHAHECIFTRGTTEAINLVATSFGQQFIQAGDEILISTMEHHANIVPWQLLCERTGAKLKNIPITHSGELDLTNIDKLITDKTKIVSIIYASNAIGTINPVRKIIKYAHDHNIPVLLDGAQATAHLPIDVQELDCDFYTLSAHKLYGPMGIGVLYGKEKWLDKMPPYQGGGDMILQVTLEHTTYNSLPNKFEAGSPAVPEAIAFARTLNYLQSLNLAALANYEDKLLKYATKKLLEIPNLTIIGKAAQKISVISFTIDNIHPHDLGTIADQFGVAIRTGHHCTMPLMDFYNIPATSRASFSFYNTYQEIDQLCNALIQAKKIFNQ